MTGIIRIFSKNFSEILENFRKDERIAIRFLIRDRSCKLFSRILSGKADRFYQSLSTPINKKIRNFSIRKGP